jgi:5,10-methylene-tetrahydrofolate dehydrogenase/methenyl tetrahydrofolate cyclohydrolase
VYREKMSGDTPTAITDFVSQYRGGYSTVSNSQRFAVIMGAANGIGKATAAYFVRNGAKVILADIQDDLGHAVTAELR